MSGRARERKSRPPFRRPTSASLARSLAIRGRGLRREDARSLLFYVDQAEFVRVYLHARRAAPWEAAYGAGEC